MPRYLELNPCQAIAAIGAKHNCQVTLLGEGFINGWLAIGL